MAYELQNEGQLKNGRKVSYVNAPFDVAVNLFNKGGFEPISARQLVQARMHNGSQHSFSTNGSYIKEGVLYIPQSIAGKPTTILIRNSLVLEDVFSAVKSHKAGIEVAFDDRERLDFILEQTKKGRANYFPLQSTNSIPTYRFGEEALTKWLFSSDAQDYGSFLTDARITQMPLYFTNIDQVNNQAAPFINQLWLGRLSNFSFILGNDRNLSYSVRARGVQVSPPKAERPKIQASTPTMESYTPKAIARALRSLKMSGLENQVLSTLRATKKQ